MRLPGYGRQIVGWHAKGRHPHFAAEPHVPVVSGGEHLAGSVETAQPQFENRRRPARRRRRVEGQNVREDQRVGSAMRHMIASAQRIGNGMAAGGVDRSEAIAAIERSERHAGARIRS